MNKHDWNQAAYELGKSFVVVTTVLACAAGIGLFLALLRVVLELMGIQNTL